MSVNHSVNEFYDGSDILSPFISLTGLPIDQVSICRMLRQAAGLLAGGSKDKFNTYSVE